MKQVREFENVISNFFGSKYAVATDSCTHAIELCLRLIKPQVVTCPRYSYVSIPMTFCKLNLNWKFNDQNWNDFYYIGNTNIIDAAVYWKKQGYIQQTLMCLSFQYRKHLNLGRGGMILTDDKQSADILKKMSYDGRDSDFPWAEQNIEMLGYHYYMTPETALLGIEKFQDAVNTEPKKWSYRDYPDLSKMKVFNEQFQ